MYLKSLKLAGFKSFADRTRLEFRSGVTVVVGPNGSGKSNLVDSLSWVLGTQSTKNLRTQKMEDVIFAGTATRPSLGKAEATLVIDNSDRQIDLDLHEVSITRRLYRDGSSDYELNGVGCRLLDIQDLLSDSGVGRHQHVIIGQGEIGRVLSASEEDHRAVIEEAAGILKHRRRKERAERRLERTDEDMIRLQDLLGEIGRQMRPLRRQAKAAERFDGLKSEVVALTLYLGGQRLNSLNRELTIASSEKSMLGEQTEVESARLKEVDARLSALTNDVGAMSTELERITGAAAMLETTTERLRRIAAISSERIRAATGRAEALVDRKADLEDERAGITEDLTALSSELAASESQAELAETRFRRLEDEEQALAVQNALSPEGAIAAMRGELSALESARSRDTREIEAIDRRLDALNAQIIEEQQEIDKINDEIIEIDETLAGLQSEYERAKKDRVLLQESWSAAEKVLDDTRQADTAARSRCEALRSARESRLNGDAQTRLEHATGSLGSLIEQLDIPSGLELAVNAALGEWADAVAFIDPDTVHDAVELMKRSGGNSVAMVSATSPTTIPAAEIAGHDSLVAHLGESHHPGLASRLLGEVIVVPDWVTGWDLITRNPVLRAVTREGDLVTVSGVRLANPDSALPALIETADAAAAAAGTTLARATSIHNAARRDFDRSRKTERSALEGLEQLESTLAGRSEAMNRLQVSVTGLSAEVARINDRKMELAEASEAMSAQISALEDRLSAMEGEETERLQAWEELESKRALVSAEREESRSEWHEVATALRGVIERERLLKDRLIRIESELARLTDDQPSDVDVASLETVARFARRALSIIEGRIVELRESQAHLRETSSGLRSELDELTREHRVLTESTTSARDRLGRLEVTLTEIRMRKEAVFETLRRDADGEVDAAMTAPLPDFTDGEEDLSGLLETKATQLRRLGPINPLAAKEYRDLEERHTFLTDQMMDVESSRAELRKVISALDQEIQIRFEQAFNEVADSFQKYFEVLFPGGRGRIRLTDPEDRRSGVAIDAQPHGKKVSSLTLLSGGERSLAALAFLFAVFEARPSPFYVLDEVEAALDDVNLRRFIRIVDAFRERAQLIIVTHQQQTMEAADVLYGVTMEPGGSSQAVRKEMRVPLTSTVGT